MRSFIWIFTAMSLLIGKDITYKIQNLTQDSPQLISLRDVGQTQQPGNPSRTSRDDTSTVWLEDFEGDVSGWTVASEWELTEESSFSPTHSFHIDDDNYDVVSSIISPVLTVPALESENEIYKLNFTSPIDTSADSSPINIKWRAEVSLKLSAMRSAAAIVVFACGQPS